MLSDATKIRFRGHMKNFGKLFLLILIVYFLRDIEVVPEWGKVSANIIQWSYGIFVVISVGLDFGAELFNVIKWTFKCVFSFKIHDLKSAATKENERIIAIREEQKRKREYECQKEKFKEEMSETAKLAYKYGLEDGYKVGYEEGDQARRRRQYWAEKDRKKEKERKEKQQKENSW